MPVESVADLSSMIDTDEFGAAATYTLSGGGVSTVNVIFDNEFIETDLQTGVEIASQNPHVMCITADLPTDAANGDTLVLGLIEYTVRVLQPDGTGISTLMLEVV